MSIGCKEDNIRGFYRYYRAEKIANACPYFVEDFEDYLEKFFYFWPNELDTLAGVV
jgi:hypothetical protein